MRGEAGVSGSVQDEVVSVERVHDEQLAMSGFAGTVVGGRAEVVAEVDARDLTR